MYYLGSLLGGWWILISRVVARIFCNVTQRPQPGCLPTITRESFVACCRTLYSGIAIYLRPADAVILACAASEHSIGRFCLPLSFQLMLMMLALVGLAGMLMLDDIPPPPPPNCGQLMLNPQNPKPKVRTPNPKPETLKVAS